ncbi:PDR/VanB family oxidoreductase [Chelativorans sp. ZYF759]|jgi:phthalate 4,5-dioxygenase reductase subunit|uniref:PDR/VanB family oxidoreductase n=1 Tax=Chelativorans sp. ZYF759 TaxID=2692213 RepID=UPI001AEEF821|nr:PDR/VanB family oxidoreductase [Chelativorans sp. ZYF759]
MTDDTDMIAAKVVSRRPLTPSITEFTLVREGGGALPPYDAGSHITVRTPAGPVRRYSLVGAGDPSPESYVIAVKREHESRGGSQSMHDDVSEGTVLEIEPPKNEFPLKQAQKYLLIAGGIGVTPIYSMARHLEEQGKDFSIIYCTRSASDTAYREEMKERFGSRLKLHHDDGNPDSVYDFWDHFAEIRNMHVYCCGPKPLMEEIKSISGHWPEGRVNFEDFKPVDVVRPEDRPFEVELARSSRTIAVPADRTILEALRESGLRTPSSCESGTCGTCKTGLISGEPDHRDMVLMDDEKDRFVMICVSRAKEGKLVLDL